MKTQQYIEKIRPLTDTKSDYAIAKLLGESRQKISLYKNGHCSFGDDVAIKVARVLDMPAGVVLADIHAERTTGEASKAWHQLAVQLRRSAAGILSLVFLFGAVGSPAPAEAGTTNNANTTYYVK